jgi:glycosyltransferase involved in cell wall biosynthesis
MPPSPFLRTVLWWGRFDENYSRNRILRAAFESLGWRVRAFHPRLSRLGDAEAALRREHRPDLVFVPCFRQRDLAAAARFARVNSRPVLFDPLISAWDKQVFERSKFPPDSRASLRLLRKERNLFQSADAVLADTDAHAQFFFEMLGVARDRLHVVPVGAEERLFAPQPWPGRDAPFEALFFGSFIALQGPETIVAAARILDGQPPRVTLLGAGPLRPACERAAQGVANVFFEDWLQYEDLPARIGRAHIVLGVFGDSRKAQRVIPNKVFQGMACARPVITAQSPPIAAFAGADSGILMVPPGDAAALAQTLAQLARERENLERLSAQARKTYEKNFSEAVISDRLGTALTAMGFSRESG